MSWQSRTATWLQGVHNELANGTGRIFSRVAGDFRHAHRIHLSLRTLRLVRVARSNGHEEGPLTGETGPGMHDCEAASGRPRGVIE